MLRTLKLAGVTAWNFLCCALTVTKYRDSHLFAFVKEKIELCPYPRLLFAENFDDQLVAALNYTMPKFLLYALL
jgi:hypothetical protein